MSKLRYIAYLVIAVAIIAAIAFGQPERLSDQNLFLKDFVDHDFLSFMGIILALSLGFVIQLRFSIGRLRKHIGNREVEEIVSELRSTVRFLIGIFGLALVLTVIKPTVSDTIPVQAVINGAALALIVFFFLIIYDVVMSLLDFDIPGD